MRTDDATTESFSLSYAASEGPARWLLLHGQSFREPDWARVEISPGRLRDGMRLVVWVCDDGSKPVIDWRPTPVDGEPVPR